MVGLWLFVPERETHENHNESAGLPASCADRFEIVLTFPPPSLPEPLTWRDIYASRGFAGRRTRWDSQFISEAEKRGHRLGIGSKQLEALDIAGALRPVAFRNTASIGDFADPTRDLQYLTFRDAVETAAWSTHARVLHEPPHDHLHVNVDYSPWQLLYVDQALELRNMALGLDVFESEPDELAEIFARWRPWRDDQAEAWAALDDQWRPLVKLLVVLQSRFYPLVTGSTPVQYEFVDGESREVDVYEAALESWDSTATAHRLGVSVDQLNEVFWFLVERGLKHEPRDGLIYDRRVALRSRVDQWRGEVRIAQDHFDAAEVVRQFIIDLTGTPPGRTPRWPMDGRQTERAHLYDVGPATRPDRDRRLEITRSSSIYPHAVHAIVEGESEEVFLRTLAENFVGLSAAEGLSFTNLRGTGQARQIGEWVRTFGPMTKRTVVIVDAEGDFPKITGVLVDNGTLAAANLHLAAGSLEEDNASADELVAIAQSFAAGNLQTLELTGRELQTRFDKQRELLGTKAQGMGEVLLKMARDPKRGGPIPITKPLFGERLADLVTRDFEEHRQEGREAMLARRPLLKFFLGLIAPLLG